MPYDFAEAHHLPNRRGPDEAHADPYDLPRQRRGITPQLHGRYPDYDVLEQQEHWDEVTRRVVLQRVHDVPPIRFLQTEELEQLTCFADVVLAQDSEPRIPVMAYVDEKLFEGKGDGYRYFDMPDDRETFRRVARGLADADFARLSVEDQVDFCKRFAGGELYGGVWATLNVSRAWSVLLRYLTQAFYAHPWAWNEIGFGGPAYPRGYSRFGSPHLQSAERETWEGREAYDRDPVKEYGA
ncbi:MAG: gluconate 2-dehydrogenase subunit 3 family protein [Actinobacteria bacterium]|nr:gluconate 2-dehydrogenase subunit 3 family protein [Actinomycetota bacterium]MBV8562117.1 gluconate 2-dehydrogenase subunit 3 family protein [Actinomycetota bacterium]